MPDNDDEPPDPRTIVEENRQFLIFTCLLFAVPSWIRFALGWDPQRSVSQSSPDWLNLVVAGGALLFYTTITTMISFDIFKYRHKMTVWDIAGLAFAIVGMAILCWNLAVKRLFATEGISIPSPGMAIAMTIGAGLLWRGQRKARSS